MRGRVLLDLAMDARDEVVERRLGGAGDPEVGAQNSFASATAAAAAPTCARPRAVITRPRGVRWRKPSWSRYGSDTSPIVSRPPPRAAPRGPHPPGAPPHISKDAGKKARARPPPPTPSAPRS